MIKEVQKVFEENGVNVILVDSPVYNEEISMCGHRMEKEWKEDLIRSIKHFDLKETYLYQANYIEMGNLSTSKQGQLVIRMYPQISIF